MTQRGVLYVTGTRAEYGLARPFLELLRESASIDLRLLVCGMHLVPELGLTVSEIKRDGYHIAAKVDTNFASDTPASMSKALGVCLMGIAQALESSPPNVVVVLGDRGEMLAGAIAAAHMNIPVVHIGGGDETRSIDNQIRYAITHFANLHLVSTAAHAQRIQSMGEHPDRIAIVGEPAIDIIRQRRFTPSEVVREQLGLAAQGPVAVCVQHPVTTEWENAADQMAETLEALCTFDMPTVVIFPNSDAGGRSMIDVIRRYSSLPNFVVQPTICHNDYLGLLSAASVLVGNSSSGIIEAPSFGLPFVNIGVRQFGREQAANVLNVKHDRNAIKGAIETALSASYRESCRGIRNPYGDGHAGDRIFAAIKGITLDDLLPQNSFLESAAPCSQ